MLCIAIRIVSCFYVFRFLKFLVCFCAAFMRNKRWWWWWWWSWYDDIR